MKFETGKVGIQQNVGLTMMAILVIVLLLALAVASFNVYTIEQRIIDFLVLITAAGLIANEVGVRNPKGALDWAMLVLIGLTLVYAITALAGWVLPAELLGIRGAVLGIAALVAIGAVVTPGKNFKR